MMGRDHALSGALVGSAVAALGVAIGEPLSLPVVATLIAVTTGFALWPDIDHPSSTVAHAFGPLSRGLAELFNVLGEAVHAATASPRDKPCRDGHRTLTHTLAFALASGGAVVLITDTWTRWGTFAVLFVALSLELRGMAGNWAKRHGWLALSTVAAVASLVIVYAEPAGVDPALLGFAVTLGSFTHCLGDSCTLAGCPWLWPIPIRGQRWYAIGTPEFLRFRTGTLEYDGEDRLRVFMWVALTLLVPAQIPEGYPWIVNHVSALWA